MRLLTGFSRAGAVRLTGVLLATIAVAACCVGVSSASATAVVNTIPVGSSPWGVSSDGTHVWVANTQESTVSEIDASTGTVVITIPVGGKPAYVSADGTHVWVASEYGAPLTEIDASTGTVVNTIPVGNDYGVSSDGTHVWVATYKYGSVSEFDASSGTFVNTIPVGGASYGVSSDGTHVWVTNSGAGTVSEIDASTGTVVNTIPVGSDPLGVSSDGTHVWIANYLGNTVSEIDASTGTVVNTIPVGSDPLGVSSDGTHVWVANSIGGTVSEIDASTGTVVNTIPVGSSPYGVSSDGTHVWVANYGGGTVSEIQISAASTLLQGPPTSATVADGAGYSGQLTVTNATGTVSYTETASADSPDVVVDSSGAITAAATLAPGTYTVSGTDSDAAGDTGTWSFTLTVPSCGVVTESVGHAPAVGTVVNLGQRISTGSGGRVVIVFPDNTTLTMGENTTIVCDKYVYDPSGNGGSGSDNSTWSLLQGLFVYVSGLIGKKDSDQINIEWPVGEIGIRGCMGIAAVLPGRKLLLHVIEGAGFADVAGKPELDVPAGEGVLAAGDSYQETLHLPPGAASLIPARDRPPSLTAVKATGKAKEKTVLRFKLSETSQLKVYVRRGKRTVVSFAGPGKKGPNKLKLSKALPKGSYTVEIVAAREGLTSIATSPLLIR
jgi:YVTN family beta-propeller protein